MGLSLKTCYIISNVVQLLCSTQVITKAFVLNSMNCRPDSQEQVLVLWWYWGTIKGNLSPRDSAIEALHLLSSSTGSLSRDNHLVPSDVRITHLTSTLSEVTRPLSLPFSSAIAASQEAASHLLLVQWCCCACLHNDPNYITWDPSSRTSKMHMTCSEMYKWCIFVAYLNRHIQLDLSKKM